MLDKRLFYIDGEWVSPSKPQDLEVINPSTEETCAVISLGGQKDVDNAVTAAKSAFQSWSIVSLPEKIELLEKFLDIYIRRIDEMALAISSEMGAPKTLSDNDQATAGKSHTENFIKILKNFSFEKKLNKNHPDHQILLEPIGVVGLITPWNWPMNQVALKVIPAVGVGCTCILKPSEIAPLSSMLFAEMMDEAGFPKGVFNLINGDGNGVGKMLSSHPDIDMISFTGSTRAGKDITKNAADTIKRVCLELGGKGANLVFKDADNNAVKRGVTLCFENSGQSCNAPSRMLVEREFYEEACKQAQEVAQQQAVDIADKEGEHIGPVVSKVQFDKIQTLIQKGIEEGANLLVGGLGKPDGLEKGYFIKPTVFADVSPNMTIAKEEIFGPVLSIIPFDTEEEAVSIANDTVYGLTNYIQTSDPEKANRISRKFRSGMVSINGASRAPGTPFGGYKQSGNGREAGIYGIEEFLEIKAISGWKE